MPSLGRALGLAVLLLPSVAAGDEVHLRGGGRVTGVIVEWTDVAVVLETGPGRVSLPLSSVTRIVESRSALESYHERAAAVGALDVEGWARLARWARDHELLTASREAWERVLAIDPGHAEANEALGRLYVDGEWMTETEAFRSRGYVPFEGRWVTPAEHDALVRERAAADRDARDRHEAELRVREAEARAREAEARAREAEAAAEQVGGTTEGIPYWWVLAGGGGLVLPPGDPGCCRPPDVGPPNEPPPLQPVPVPVATPIRPSSIGPLGRSGGGRPSSPPPGGLRVPTSPSRTPRD